MIASPLLIASSGMIMISCGSPTSGPAPTQTATCVAEAAFGLVTRAAETATTKDALKRPQTGFDSGEFWHRGTGLGNTEGWNAVNDPYFSGLCCVLGTNWKFCQTPDPSPLPMMPPALSGPGQ